MAEHDSVEESWLKINRNIPNAEKESLGQKTGNSNKKLQKKTPGFSKEVYEKCITNSINRLHKKQNYTENYKRICNKTHSFVGITYNIITTGNTSQKI